MAVLVRRGTDTPEVVPQERVDALLESGDYTLPDRIPLFRESAEGGGSVEWASSGAEAQERLSSGLYTLPAGQRVRLTGAQGESATIAAEELGEALSRQRDGQPLWQLADSTVSRESRLASEDRGAGAAFAAGAGSELTMGALPSMVARVSDPIPTDPNLSPHEGPTRIAPVEQFQRTVEEHPTAFAAGRIAAAVGTGIASGGTGAAARGLAAAPTAIAARAGLGAQRVASQLLGRSVLQRAGQSIGQRAAQRGLSLAVGGAVEGALFGASGAIQESALANRELTAEGLLAAAGTGAVWGGAGGAVLGAASAPLGAGLSRLARGSQRMGRDVRESFRAFWRRGAGTELDDGVADLITSEQVGSALTEMSARGRAARAIVANSDEVIEESTRRLTEDLTELERHSRLVHSEAVGGIKRRNVLAAVDEALVDRQVAQAQHLMDRAQAVADDIMQNPHVYNGPGGVAAGRRLGQLTTGFRQQLDTAARAAVSNPRATAADIFVSLDNFKRGVGRIVSRVRDPEAQRLMGDFVDGNGGLYGVFRQALEDSTVWGERLATGIQQSTNRAWAKYLSSSSKFRSKFLTTEGIDDINLFEKAWAADSAKVSGYVGSVGRAAAETNERLLRQTVEAQAELLEEIAQNYSLSAAGKTSLAQARKATEGIRRTVAQAEQRARIVNQYKQLSGESNRLASVAQVAGGAAGGAVGTAIGSAVGHPIWGGAAGTWLGRNILASAVPANKIRVLTGLDIVAQTIGSRLGKAASHFVRHTGPRMARATGRVSKATRRVGRRAIAPAAAQASFDQQVRAVASVTSDPQNSQRRIASSTGDIIRDAPSVSRHVSTTAWRAAQFLQSKIPAGALPTQHAFPHLMGSRVSQAEMARFNEYFQAVNSPLEVIEDIENGHVSREAVEAIEHVYPALFAQLQVKVMEELAGLDSPPAYEVRVKLGILFGIASDPTMRPEMIARLQATYGSGERESRGTEQGAPNMAQFFAPQEGRIHLRRAALT